MAKKFFYVCAGLFLLVLSYHFGASTAGAQSAGIVAAAVMDGGRLEIVTQSGDVWDANPVGNPLFGQPRGNIFSGGPTTVVPQSWGQVKSTYRK